VDRSPIGYYVVAVGEKPRANTDRPMNTGRLDALLLIAAVAQPQLWSGIVVTEVWEKWRRESDFAGGEYVAVPNSPVSVHVIATLAPPQLLSGVRQIAAEQAAIEMQKHMALAIEVGWLGEPDVSEKWASELDGAERELWGQTMPWAWPTVS
jgi:hypothetical protein